MNQTSFNAELEALEALLKAITPKDDILIVIDCIIKESLNS